ncbi:MAG TPA: hypothetical protein VMT03_09395 [Polyangia bacterium]|nr:hypothetical protein [Polyangia bacterium]
MPSSPTETTPGAPPAAGPDHVDVSTRPGPRPPGVRNALLARMNPSERSYWQLVPRKNFRMAILLLLLIVGVIAVKRSGALSFSHMIDQIAPAVPASKQEPAFQHLQVKPVEQPQPKHP